MWEKKLENNNLNEVDGSMVYKKCKFLSLSPQIPSTMWKMVLGFFLCAFECHQLYGIDEAGVEGAEGIIFILKVITK